MPRATSLSATANGNTPPPAIRPIGDKIGKASALMADPSSMPVTVIRGETQRTMLAVADKGQDFRNRRILGCERLPLVQPFGKNPGTMEEPLIERSHRGEPLPGEFAALHADDVETFEAGILSVDETERNDVAANAADAADHHLRPDPGELVHRR